MNKLPIPVCTHIYTYNRKCLKGNSFIVNPKSTNDILKY